MNTEFKQTLGKVAYHAACHQRVQNIGQKTRELLQLIPGTEIEMIERCSDHDGTYAVKSESHEISMKICRPVVNKVNDANPQYYTSDCPMAGHQIQNGLDAHKQDRVITAGPNASLHFEDRDTIHYQIQEILRVERIFEAAGIEEKLAAYNPLTPDGQNWKATFMIEFPDVNERNAMLRRLLGIEDRTWASVGSHEPVFAIADEDIERDDGEQTSAVHFLRFELDAAMCKAVRAGEPISIGIDHPEYCHELKPLPENFRASLATDLD